MSEPKQSNNIKNIMQLNDEERVDHLLCEVVQHREIWILTDEHGCVMLNTDDEDCVPIWPSQETAELWINEEWATCKAEAVSLNKWFSRWTYGLLDDELAVVVFPNLSEQGIVMLSDELETEIKQQAKKQNIKLS